MKPVKVRWLESVKFPFRRYYGSVDSTPLFVLLAAAYFKRTGDRELIAGVWPNIEKALDWIDRYGDRDGDGFVEYGQFDSTGIVAARMERLFRNRSSMPTGVSRTVPLPFAKSKAMSTRPSAKLQMFSERWADSNAPESCARKPSC